jgi:hypothetical protein
LRASASTEASSSSRSGVVARARSCAMALRRSASACTVSVPASKGSRRAIESASRWQARPCRPSTRWQRYSRSLWKKASASAL